MVALLDGDGALRGAGCIVRYASVEFATFDFIRAPRPNDPNPLPYPGTVLLECADPERLARDGDAVKAQIAALGAPAVAHLYRRSDHREFVPRIRR